LGSISAYDGRDLTQGARDQLELRHRGVWALTISCAITSGGGGRSSLSAYFRPTWTAFQAERGRHFSVIVDGISG
jgi:hypothetical protein